RCSDLRQRGRPIGRQSHGIEKQNRSECWNCDWIKLADRTLCRAAAAIRLLFVWQADEPRVFATGSLRRSRFGLHPVSNQRRRRNQLDRRRPASLRLCHTRHFVFLSTVSCRALARGSERKSVRFRQARYSATLQVAALFITHLRLNRVTTRST